MFFFIFISLRIIYTDLRYRKIYNKDLLVILLVAALHHRLHFLAPAIVILIIGSGVLKMVGAGDLKLFALIVAMKANYFELTMSITAIVIASSILIIFYLIRHRQLKIRVPMAPALCVGLLI
ncbi:MAG: hypothetical protein RL129_38 [Actinomycetota bacterium]|jgi:Flp pilus assembly protein protease CpaA